MQHPSVGSKTRLDDEKRLVIDYGLRNKRELWKAQSILRKYRAAARELVALRSAGITSEIYQTKKTSSSATSTATVSSERMPMWATFSPSR